MAEFLLELFSEEIPARMQARAAQNLQDLITKGLADAGPRFRQCVILCDAAPSGGGG